MLDPTFTISKNLASKTDTIPNSAGTKNLKAMNMLKQRPRTIGTGRDRAWDN